MYFPFTIAACILIAIVLAGKLKKKAILVDGKMQMISLQNTVPTLNAFIAPLQTLCILTQAVLALYFSYYIHFGLAAIFYGAIVVLNFIFLYWFIKNFYSRYLPDIGDEVKDKFGRPIIVN